VQERVVREIRSLRAMWRGLETRNVQKPDLLDMYLVTVPA